MRYQLQTPLEGTDALVTLFNKYLKALSTPMTVAEPSYYSMQEMRQHVLSPKTKQAKAFQHCATSFYKLTILRQSLEDIHAHVLEAISTLTGFFATYGDNLLAYALDNRRRSIEEYGSDDPTDWYRENEADESEEWKITYKDDDESLKYYTLHAELGRFFGDESCGRGEYIGTSSANDFAHSSILVANKSSFSLRKMFESMGAQMVRPNEDGSTSPIPLADHIEAEMNEDIKAERLVWTFNVVIGFAQVLRERYERLKPDNLAGYIALEKCLCLLRDVQFPEDLLDGLMALPEN